MIEFKLPALGADMDEGKLLEWKVRPGDDVKRGDVVAVVDTSKAAIDVESWVEGTVETLVVVPGQTVPVGTVLALLRPSDDMPSAAAPPSSEVPVAVAPGPPPQQQIRVSPAARKRAAELGVALATVSGSGPSGAISLDDVERAPRAAPTASAADRDAAMRRTIAAAMARAKRDIPHYYLAEVVPLAHAVAWLNEYNAGRSVTERVLPAALLLKAVALAARRYPEMNGLFRDGTFTPAAAVHLGIAIALRGGGLIAPAIHDADRKPLPELMSALADLVRRARGGSLRSSELADPGLTVTNLGDRGVSQVFGVIYPPQVALIGFGRIADQVLAQDGAVRVVPAVQVSLSADHRVSDGHRGALFLAEIRTLLQQPELLIGAKP